MFRYIFILFATFFIISCGGNEGDIPYEDYDQTINAIECVFFNRVGKAQKEKLMRVKIFFTNDVYKDGNNCDYNGFSMRINRDYKSARKSSLRHEFFAHRFPHIQIGNANPNHSDFFTELESRLNKDFNSCWGKALKDEKN